MAPSLPKPVRNFVYRARKRSIRYHEKKWIKAKRGLGETSGTHYRNFAGEKFKVFRKKFRVISKSPVILLVDVRVSVLSGNKGIEQKTMLTVELDRGIVDIADINEGRYSCPPDKKIRGRNIMGAIVEEAEAIGREQFGNSSFKLHITPKNDVLKKMYKKFGFREFDTYSNELEKIIPLR
jgi:hypothetical protein